MTEQGGAPRELTWASLAIAIAATLIYVGTAKARTKIRELDKEVDQERKAVKGQFDMLTKVRAENQELRKFKDLITGGKDGEVPAEGEERTTEDVAREILGPDLAKLEDQVAELNYELDGPWEEGEDVEGKTAAGESFIALAEELDPEGRAPEEDD